MSTSNDPTLPAILGGMPLRPEGPPAWPPAWEEVSLAVKRSLDEGGWGLYHGPNSRLLTERLSSYHDVEFVELCCSGTFAIELALRALQIGPGAEVILAAYDFIGNFNDVVAVGARPVLVDLDPDNWNLNPELIGEAIGPNTRAVLVSHLHGGVVPMKRVVEIAREHGLRVIEDACQMPGALIDGRKAGTWGDAGVISFGGSKLLSAGRGGALLTSSPEIRQRAQVYCNRGNHAYPLSELQATVLLPQLERLDDRNRERSKSVSKLAESLKAISGLRLLENRETSDFPGYYKLGFRYDPVEFDGLSRELFVRAARAEGIEFNAGFRALHLCRSSRRFRKAGELAVATIADANMLTLHHPALLAGDDAIDQVARSVKRIRGRADSIKNALS
ncbi:MAG TPA: aminotransferase class V-fold PLP-dependent enzyme [Blastocatellia bacterium]|jgi:dTDP-4-amino-4,6-dideoxygalactose transaminase|nr:aminotransferase class V-fold PLP-dependent enzyme [Blastocatellia bacterium]